MRREPGDLLLFELHAADGRLLDKLVPIQYDLLFEIWDRGWTAGVGASTWHGPWRYWMYLPLHEPRVFRPFKN